MPVTRTSFATTDVATVRALMSVAYGGRLSIEESGEEAFLFEQRVAAEGPLTVSTMRFTGHIEASTDGFSEVLFADILEGPYVWQSRDARGDQDRSLILPAKQELSVRFEAVRSVLITVDDGTVTRWLARYGGLPPSPALLHRPSAGSDAVRKAIRFLGEIMPNDVFESDLVRANLLDVLLSMTAHQLLGEATTVDHHGAPASLRRAEEYLQSHASEPVSIADAAEAARMSVRGLQQQFQRWYQLTPAQYLRNARLDGARAELTEARLSGRPTKVSDLARRWGFAHAGRFAAYYAEAYGESPAETLREHHVAIATPDGASPAEAAPEHNGAIAADGA
ncbi:helix-turn-helix transcriptional regulator [Microbacterium sp. NPDC019599]|uniref:helix-turn-helix transcriptional regulator n=1 Tax=Microbacterium sp. NPDC019599 TaxID=3154690 RepID=UPI0033E9DBD5